MLNYGRKQRGKTESIFLVKTSAIDKYSYQFEVLGSTRTVYTVTISNMCGCTCSDFKFRKNRCKHIFFVLIKMMRYKCFANLSKEEMWFGKRDL